MAALDNAAAMDAPPRQEEDAFAAFRNAKHDPARREVSVLCVLCSCQPKERGGGEVAGPLLLHPPSKDSGVYAL